MTLKIRCSDPDCCAPEQNAATVREALVLHIEVPVFNVEGAQDVADEFYDGDVFPILIEEWMRGDVIVVANDIPGEKSQNHEFNLHALEGRIVDAEIVRERKP